MGIIGKVNKDASLLRDSVFAATDGVVTTFAVVAGSLGASLSPKVVIILGLANLFADGFSMSSGIYLGAKSEIEYEKKMKNTHWKQDFPFLQGLFTFISFVVGGIVPLLPFLYKFTNPVGCSIAFVFAFLVLVGIARSMVTGKHVLRGIVEMVLIGGLAALVAFLVGNFADQILG